MTAGADTIVLGARVFEDLPGVRDIGELGPGGMPCARTTVGELVDVIRALKYERGFNHLSLLTAVDGIEQSSPEPAAEASAALPEPAAAPAPADAAPATTAPSRGPGVEMIYGLTRQADHTTAILKVALAEDALSAPTLSRIWPGAEPLEREVYDLFGVGFEGNLNLHRIVLRDDFVGHPLRKSFELTGGVTQEQVDVAVASHGDIPADVLRQEAVEAIEAWPERPHSPFAEAAQPGDRVLRSERILLNIGPQHPSTHGVLHFHVAMEGETVVAAWPTQGYLHRCIEKLCEKATYRACTALLDRCDYVSGFHTELAYVLALEELLGIEVPRKADYLRVLFGELVRITSHHTWYAACGLDLGALTPFLYAFRDRERLLDIFEAVTGGRMMFNYFRPGGVKFDLQPEVAAELKEFLLGFDAACDEYEVLLTNNEVFRARTRGIGIYTPKIIEDYCVTGPMARASGVDIDLRRDEPYAAYGDFEVRVALGEAGDTFDRYLVRIAEMRESCRLALLALEGMPEGDFINPDVPRALRPSGTTYRRVESPRGELGVYLVADGSQQPWRLKVRSPAFSNIHSSPAVLPGGRVADVIVVAGSIDIVMGEIDR